MPEKQCNPSQYYTTDKNESYKIVYYYAEEATIQQKMQEYVDLILNLKS